MATQRDGQSYLEKLVILGSLLAVTGLILYQGSSLRREIRDLRTEMRAEIGELRGEFGELHAEFGELRERVDRLEVAVARIEARRLLRLMFAVRFAASGEGASYGGPATAAYLLLARAQPEIDAVLGMIDRDALTELAEDLWEDRANILARANPVP